MTVETEPTTTEPAEAEATEPTEAQAIEPAEADTTEAGGRRWVRAAAVVVCMVLAVVAALQLLQLRSTEAQQQDVERATAAAKSSVVTLLSYDYRTIAADMARARTQLTPSFAAQYDQVATGTVVPAATSQKVITSAAVTGTSVVSHSGNQVVLLLFINQSSTSSVADKPQRGIDLSRVRVTMQRIGDAWRIADVRGV